MKLISIVLVVITSLSISCHKDNNGNESGIVIKGSIASNSLKKSSNSNAAYSSASLADAKSILVFNSSGGYELYSIEDSSFAARAMQGTAAALVFIGANNEFIGCLQSGGLNVLPLVSLKDGDNTVIDLSSLTLNGTNVIPSNNPIGDEIDLNQEEIERYRQFGAFFESLSQNIDVDENGIPDLVDKKALFVSTIYDIYCGMWGLNDIAPEVIDTSAMFINYTMRVWGQKNLIPQNQEVILSGPEGSPYNDIEKSYFTEAPDGFIIFFRRPVQAPPGSPYGSAFLPFKNGRYNVNLDNKSYSLQYSQVDAKYYFVLALPTVHTNDNNEITSISIEYKDINGEPINPENFVYQTMVQLNNGGSQLEQLGVLWESPETRSNTELYNFVSDKKVKESDVTGINVCYLDMVGNAYNITFRR